MAACSKSLILINDLRKKNKRLLHQVIDLKITPEFAITLWQDDPEDFALGLAYMCLEHIASLWNTASLADQEIMLKKLNDALSCLNS